MFQIVNGYVCQTCCDVTAAKAGKDPAHPNAPPGSTDKSGQPTKPGQTSTTSQASGSEPSNANRPAVTFGGALAQGNGAPSVGPSTPPAAPSPPAYSGGLLNVSA
jgi:hypothetical protein